MNPISKFLSTDNWLMLDFEANGLLDDSEKKGPAVTKIHVLGYWHYSFGAVVKTETNYEKIKEIIDSVDYVFCHNGILYDDLLCQKILGFSFVDKIIDTLGLSWYLHPKRLKHGLEAWGNELGIYKPEVTDWSEQPIEVYINRVVEDVKIQAKLSYKLVKDLLELYDGQRQEAFDIMSLLNSILQVYQEQKANPFVLDVDLVNSNLVELRGLKEIKEELLSKEMHPVPVYAKKSRPKVMTKQDKSLSHYAVEWYKLLDEIGAPSDIEEVKYVVGYEDPNPSSPEQVKAWLFSIGWGPTIFKDTLSVTGAAKKVPQIKDKDGNLCKDIIRLSEEYPAVKELVDLSVINSRIAVLKGFLRDMNSDGTIYGDIAGITNTCRSRHKRIQNLAKTSSLHGQYIRSCLTVGEGELLLGCDLKALEATTKVNMTCEIDPTTLEEFVDPEFDTHLDLAIFSNALPQDDSDYYKALKKKAKSESLSEQEHRDFSRIDKVRNTYKVLNYMSLYSASARRIAKELGVHIREGERLHKAYWAKNFSVKTVSDNAETKTLFGTTWIYNKIVKVWFENRSDHTKFSALNQGFGSIVFYMWVREVRRRGVKITLNYHDELQIRVLHQDVETVKNNLQSAMDVINNQLNLRVPIEMSIQVGHNYGDTH